jgi:hypothetical protein
VPRVKDAIVTTLAVLGLATLITTHVGLSARLFLRQRPRWHGLLALFVPPLAVLWGIKAGWKGLAVLWLAALGVYVTALVAVAVMS